MAEEQSFKSKQAERIHALSAIEQVHIVNVIRYNKMLIKEQRM